MPTPIYTFSAMKPNDLLDSFLKNRERIPSIQERIFFIPSLFKEHSSSFFPGWEAIFERPQPLSVEFCSGNGQWIVEQAEKHPQINWVAVEKQGDRVRKIDSKTKQKGLKNLFIVYGEALCFCHFYIPSSSVTRIFINFPDPWPKKRHHKHRLMQKCFVSQLERILHPDGKGMFVTDDRPYLDSTIKEILSHSSFRASFSPPFFTTDFDGYGTSTFEKMWREQGRKIFYFPFEKEFE